MSESRINVSGASFGGGGGSRSERPTRPTPPDDLTNFFADGPLKEIAEKLMAGGELTPQEVELVRKTLNNPANKPLTPTVPTAKKHKPLTPIVPTAKKPPSPKTEKTRTTISHTATLIDNCHRRSIIYGLSGLLLGLSTIIAGTIMCVHGVVGSSSWSAKILGAQSNINDAGPGVVLFLVGLFVVRITRPEINLKDIHDE